jgi:CRISPR-associated RAMP protein (TIGR02581 family)
MFKNLTNEAVLTVQLSVDGPLLIRSGEANSLDPALPDMRFVRCQHNGRQTVYLPGSSLKGVFRTRYEQLVQLLGERPCNLFDRFDCCSRKLNEKHKYDKVKDGTQRYDESCAACRLFGSLELGSRIRFTDAYPVDIDAVKFGMRNGVGIDRKTGAASTGALYDFEVMESGAFEFQIHFTNFAHYQLALVLEILNDVDNGFVSFGMGTSRGNGSMKVANKDAMLLVYRSYQSEQDLAVGTKQGKDMFSKKYELSGIAEILHALGLQSQNDLRAAFAKEGWKDVLIHGK